MNRLRASRRSESLLLAFLLWTAPLASGCGSWRAGRFADLPDHSSEGEELLVITGNRAFHLRATSVDATGIRGTALRTWTLSGGRVDVADVAYFLETNDSPERVAAHLG